MAADTFQIKRGSTAAVNAYVPAVGEPVLNTDNGVVKIGDGVTAGGKYFLSYSDVPTNQLYTEYGAIVQRVADRLFVGDAAKNTGTNVTSQLDWLTTFQLASGRTNGFLQSSQSAFLNNLGTDAFIAQTVATQNLNLYDNYDAIGSVHIAVANKTTGTGKAYSIYGESYRMPGVTAGAYGAELDTINKASYAPSTPYVQDIGQTVGLQLASGGELSPVGQFDASIGLNLQYNGAKYGVGINFGATAIRGTDGVTGTGFAATMAKGHMYQWYSSTGLTSSILGDCSTPALSLDQSFVDNQVRWRNKAGKNVLQMSAAANSVNYLSLRSAITGTPAQVVAAGDDTDVGLFLSSQGAGQVQVGVGDLALQTVGKGLRVKEGSNAKQGVAILVAGSVVVANTSVTASSRIMLTGQQDGGTVGFVRVSARTAGTSFTITSSSGTDTSTIAYQIFEPA